MSNKWYRGKLVKGMLAAFAHVLAVLLIISMLWIWACPSAAEDALEGKNVEYEDSDMLSSHMFSDARQIVRGIQIKENLETDGVHDENKLVDIKKYIEEGVIDGRDESGLTYKLGELEAWADGYWKYDNVESGDYGSSTKDPIIVGQKPDKTYEYFLYSDLRHKIDSGEFRFVMETEDMTAYDILQELKDGSWYEGSATSGSYALLDSENTVRLIDCWNYDGFWIEEKYAPIGAGSVLELANEKPEWNGKLNEIYQDIKSTLYILNDDCEIYREVLQKYEEGSTNLTYLYADKETERVYTNRAEYESYDSLEKNMDKLRQAGMYAVIMPKLSDFESNMMEANASDWNHQIGAGTQSEDYIFIVALDTDYPVQDIYLYMKDNYQKFAGKAGFMIQLAIGTAVLLLGIIIWLTAVAGRRPEDEELHCNVFDRWKTEIAAALVTGVWTGCMIILGSAARSFGFGQNGYLMSDGTVYYLPEGFNTETMIICGIIGFVTCSMFLIGYLSLVRRLKAGTVWKNSLLRWVMRHGWNFIRHLPVVWKYVLFFALFLLSQMLMFTTSEFIIVLAGFVVDVAGLAYIVQQAVGRKRLSEGVMRISSGELEYKIPTVGLTGEQLELAKRVNNIGAGLDAAVENSIKNERLKTDLITNVSHDIKTPLTSIINYIDLLKRENIQDSKIQGYLEVLEAKAQRLKVLTEDVVEASKVSSGNVTLECMNLNLVEMVQQTSGEFSEKFENRGLKEVINLPEEPAVIWADGRRMWRILENIYNNVAKYAMEGTRVYSDLSQTEEQVRFSLKNISEQPLNISADELTERFIRGDVSRSTEGSGLGLSIAKNLASLMGGKFELYLDGDLFRVTITFPRVKK